MKGLKEKVVFIAGGSLGIGKAVALAFAKEGTKVVICARKPKPGNEVVQEIKAGKGEAIFVKADVSQAAQVKAALKRTVQTYGRLDFAFNNAAIGGKLGPIHECAEDNWDNIMNINLKGVFLCMKYEISQMLRNGGGVIVNTSSEAGVVGSSSGLGAYSASKHGVIGLSRSAALEYAQKGIRVNIFCPGTTRTPMLENQPKEWIDQLIAKRPMGRLPTPSEIADSVLWLCSDSASYVTGHTLLVDGGYTAQ